MQGVHFLNLPVGIYAVKATLSGFNAFTNDTVQVATRAATPLTIKMSVAGTSETINVTAATPIIDVKRDTTTTNVTLEELQNIPTARDPWVIMQTVPTIYVDRVNIGGSESGQQSNYIGKGSPTTDNTWNIDGVPVTDMGATGSTPTYYAFDMFQEMSVTTGGADAQNPTPGVQLNLVLKKGSNTPHGNASIYFENQSLQANNIPPDLAASLGGTGGKGNRTDRYLDESFDLGGPIFKDRLFAWGSLGYTDVRNLTLTSQLDETKLKNSAFKADYVVDPSVRANFAFFRGDKQKNGRGVGPTHLIETAWNQKGPTNCKGEATSWSDRNFRDRPLRLHLERVHAGSDWRPRRQLLQGRWRHLAQLVLLHQHQPPAAVPGRRRELLYRQARSEVRVRLAEDPGAVGFRGHRRPDLLGVDRLPDDDCAGAARLQQQHAGQVHQWLGDRHHLARPPDGDGRHPLRSSDVLLRADHQFGDHRHPFDAAADGPGCDQRVCLQFAHAACGGDVRPGRIPQDCRARELRDVRVAAAGKRRLVRVADSAVHVRVLQRHRSTNQRSAMYGGDGRHQRV
jgi:hypothetical protein